MRLRRTEQNVKVSTWRVWRNEVLQKSLADYFAVCILFGNDGRKSFIPGTEQFFFQHSQSTTENTNRSLLEKIQYPNNLKTAWKRVKSNTFALKKKFLP